MIRGSKGHVFKTAGARSDSALTSHEQFVVLLGAKYFCSQHDWYRSIRRKNGRRKVM